MNKCTCQSEVQSLVKLLPATCIIVLRHLKVIHWVLVECLNLKRVLVSEMICKVSSGVLNSTHESKLISWHRRSQDLRCGGTPFLPQMVMSFFSRPQHTNYPVNHPHPIKKLGSHPRGSALTRKFSPENFRVLALGGRTYNLTPKLSHEKLSSRQGVHLHPLASAPPGYACVSRKKTFWCINSSVRFLKIYTANIVFIKQYRIHRFVYSCAFVDSKVIKTRSSPADEISERELSFLCAKEVRPVCWNAGLPNSVKWR